MPSVESVDYDTENLTYPDLIARGDTLGRFG